MHVTCEVAPSGYSGIKEPALELWVSVTVREPYFYSHTDTSGSQKESMFPPLGNTCSYLETFLAVTSQ